MSKIVDFRKFKKSLEPRRPKDSWCRPLELDNGKVLYGCAAREKRLSEVGGVEQLLRETLDRVDARVRRTR